MTFQPRSNVPASAKQLELIDKLVAEKDVHLAVFAELARQRGDDSDFSMKQASAWITILLAMPKAPQPAPAKEQEVAAAVKRATARVREAAELAQQDKLDTEDLLAHFGV